MLDRAAEPDEAGTYAGLGRPEWDALLLADLQGRAPVDRRKDDRPSLLGWQFRQRGAHHVADVTPQYLTSSGLCSRLIIAEAAKSSGSVGTARRMRSATMVRLRVMVRTHDVTEPRRWSNTGAWRQTRMSASWATSSATEASLVMELRQTEHPALVPAHERHGRRLVPHGHTGEERLVSRPAIDHG
jgi:hypothetical protein